MNRITLSLRLLATIAMIAALFLPMATISCNGSPQSIRQDVHSPLIWLLALWPIPLIAAGLRTRTRRILLALAEGIVCVGAYLYSDFITGVSVLLTGLFAGESRAEMGIGWILKDGGFALYFIAVLADLARGLALRRRARAALRYTI